MANTATDITEKYKPPSLIVTKSRPLTDQYVTNNQRGSSYYSPDPHVINTGQDTLRYSEIASHPSVAYYLALLQRGIFWTPGNVVAQNDYDKYPEFQEIDEKVIDLINRSLKMLSRPDAKNSFDDVIQILHRDAIVSGFNVAEANWTLIDNEWHYESITPYTPSDFEIRLNSGFDIEEIYYGTTNLSITRENNLLDKFITTAYPNNTHNNFYGTSILSSIYQDVKVLETLELCQSNGIRELSFQAILHIYTKTNQTDEDVKKMQQQIANIGAGDIITVGAIPDVEKGTMIPEHEFTPVQSRASDRGVLLIRDVITDINDRIRNNFGWPADLGVGNPTAAGSYAKAQEEMDLATMNIADHQQFVSRMVTSKILYPLMKYNYPELLNDRRYIMPIYTRQSVEEDADAVTIDNMIKMMEAGVISMETHKAFIENALKVPPAEDDAVNLSPTRVDAALAVMDKVNSQVNKNKILVSLGLEEEEEIITEPPGIIEEINEIEEDDDAPGI